MLLETEGFFPSSGHVEAEEGLDELAVHSQAAWEWVVSSNATGLPGNNTNAESNAVTNTVASNGEYTTGGEHFNSLYIQQQAGAAQRRPASVVVGRATTSGPMEDYFSYSCLKHGNYHTPGIGGEVPAEFYVSQSAQDGLKPSSYYEGGLTPNVKTEGTGDKEGVLLYVPVDVPLTRSQEPQDSAMVSYPGFEEDNMQWFVKYDGDGDGSSSKSSPGAVSRRGRPKRLKGADNGKRKNLETEDGRRRTGEVTCYRGVYFDQIRHLWRANWPEESVIIDKATRTVVDVRRCTRTKGFSAKKFGFQEAQKLAIEHREKMTGPGMVRHYVYQHDSQTVIPGSRNARRTKTGGRSPSISATAGPPEMSVEESFLASGEMAWQSLTSEADVLPEEPRLEPWSGASSTNTEIAETWQTGTRSSETGQQSTGSPVKLEPSPWAMVQTPDEATPSVIKMEERTSIESHMVPSTPDGTTFFNY